LRRFPGWAWVNFTARDLFLEGECPTVENLSMHCERLLGDFRCRSGAHPSTSPEQTPRAQLETLLAETTELQSLDSAGARSTTRWPRRSLRGSGCATSTWSVRRSHAAVKRSPSVPRMKLMRTCQAFAMGGAK